MLSDFRFRPSSILSMRIRYDEEFVEGAVFLCTSGRRKGVPSLQIARFNREREKLYTILDPDERNAAFFQLNVDWFREWGIEKILMDVLNEFPLLRASLGLLAFRKARRRNEEGAELYVPRDSGDTEEPSGGNAVVALSVERFEHDERVMPFLRHEFMHLHDMVDMAFGYMPELELAISGMNQQRLARERYRLLWDIVIDGRLSRANRSMVAAREQRWIEFERGFGFWPKERRQSVFDGLWQNEAPKHRELAALVADPRDLNSACGPKPGAPCPLCGFPTFDWRDADQVPPNIVEAIKREFPNWAIAQGLCGRCYETYQVATAPTR
jgi:hypothetical protein